MMLCTLTIVYHLNTGSNVIVYRKKLDKFPAEVERFSSTNIVLQDSIVRELDPDIYVFREYQDQNGNSVTLYIGYYGTQKGGRTGHNPAGCYPGNGWAILSNDKFTIDIPLDGKANKLTFNRMRVKKNNAKQLVYYWYHYNGGVVITSGLSQNIHRFKNKLLYNRNEGAFIRVSTSYSQNLGDKTKLLNKFLKRIFPLIVEYWPEEREES